MSLGKPRKDWREKPLTKREFEETLTRVFATLGHSSTKARELGASKTSAPRRSGGYTGTRKSPNKTVDAEG